MALDYAKLIENIIEKRHQKSSPGPVRVEKVIALLCQTPASPII